MSLIKQKNNELITSDTFNFTQYFTTLFLLFLFFHCFHNADTANVIKQYPEKHRCIYVEMDSEPP